MVDPRKPAGGDPPGNDPAACAAAWTSGQPVDWAVLHGGSPPGRVALPGYPFGGERVRLDAADAELAAVGAAPTTGAAPAAGAGTAAGTASATARALPAAGDGTPEAEPVAEEVLLTRDWVRAEPAGRDAPPACTAVLAAPGTEELAARLAAALPAAEVLGTARLDTQLADPGTRWDRYDAVVDLAGCAGSALPVDSPALHTWLRWLQQMVDRGSRELRAVLVSRGPESGLGGASRVGLYRMLQSEYRQLRSRHVDVGRCGDEQLCARVADELAFDSEEPEVAYREGVRHRASLRTLPPAARPVPRLPEGHVLWVTGGTRGLGLLTARHFVARHGVRKLVLTGREELPPRAEWAAHIGADTALGRKLRPLADLADQGVQLEVPAVPLTDAAALARTLADVKRRLGPVGGVVHCAGVTDAENPAFVRKTPESMARVLAPKVFGLDALTECFREEPLEFFVLYSSVTAAVPALAVGQSDYALANAYLDEVAAARPYGLPLISVQWPSWRDTGMGEVRSAAYRASGLAALPDTQGLALLDRALAAGERVILPAAVRADADWRPELLTGRRPTAPAARPAAPAADRKSVV